MLGPNDVLPLAIDYPDIEWSWGFQEPNIDNVNSGVSKKPIRTLDLENATKSGTAGFN